jgi:hypothetical protein
MRKLSIMLILSVLLAIVLQFGILPALFDKVDAGETVIERTTIIKVYQRTSQAGYDYCDIKLANGRWLTYVWGAQCQMRAGTVVTLVYDANTTCKINWLGKRICSTAKTLTTWF